MTVIEVECLRRRSASDPPDEKSVGKFMFGKSLPLFNAILSFHFTAIISKDTQINKGTKIMNADVIKVKLIAMASTVLLKLCFAIERTRCNYK